MRKHASSTLGSLGSRKCLTFLVLVLVVCGGAVAA